MVIFQYNLYIFGIHLRTVLYPKRCYNDPCYKEVVVYQDPLLCIRERPFDFYGGRMISNNKITRMIKKKKKNYQD